MSDTSPKSPVASPTSFGEMEEERENREPTPVTPTYCFPDLKNKLAGYEYELDRLSNVYGSQKETYKMTKADFSFQYSEVIRLEKDMPTTLYNISLKKTQLSKAKEERAAIEADEPAYIEKALFWGVQTDQVEEFMLGKITKLDHDILDLPIQIEALHKDHGNLSRRKMLMTEAIAGVVEHKKSCRKTLKKIKKFIKKIKKVTKKINEGSSPRV